MSLVNVISEAGLTLEPGGTSKLLAALPWEFDYTIEASSSYPSIFTVSADGAIQAVGAGCANLSGTLTVDDGVKLFEIEITVAKEGTALEAESIER